MARAALARWAAPLAVFAPRRSTATAHVTCPALHSLAEGGVAFPLHEAASPSAVVLGAFAPWGFALWVFALRSFAPGFVHDVGRSSVNR